jgi:hypothetical protein
MFEVVLKYFERIGIAISILINVILGGPSNQTFSARNHKWQQDGKWNLVWLIDFLVFWDKYHCFHSWIYYKTTRDLRKTYIENKKLDNTLKTVYYDDYYME